MASSVQTDYQLRQATQVAYMDLSQYLREMDYDPSKKLPAPVKLKDLLANDQAAREKLSSFGNDWEKWSISDVNDKNSSTGFFGCVIDTGDGNATVAFRGSEGMNDLSNLKRDWGENDFAMLGAIMTPQQDNARAYADYLASRGLLDQYNHICSTGHSLGGNLSDVFCLAISNHSGIWAKFDGSTSFDGPGFNREFLITHAAEIARASSRMTHYRWSLVGACLFPLPGATQVDLMTKDYGSFTSEYGEEDKGELFWDTLQKHDTRSLMFDKNGAALVANNSDALIVSTQVVTSALALLPLTARQKIISAVVVACSIPEAFKAIIHFVHEATEVISDAVTFVVDGAIEIAGSIYEWGKDVVIGAVNGVIELAENVWDTATEIGKKIGEGIEKGAAAVGNFIGGLYSRLTGSGDDTGPGGGSGSHRGASSSGGHGYGGGRYGGGNASGNIWIDADGVIYATGRLQASLAIVEACSLALTLVEGCLDLLNPFGLFTSAHSSLNSARRMMGDIDRDIRNLASSVEASANGYKSLERDLARRCSSFAG